MKLEKICNCKSFDVAPEQVGSVALNKAHRNVLVVQWLANDVNRIVEYSGMHPIILENMLNAQRITQATVDLSNDLYADVNVGSIPVAHLVSPVLKADVSTDRCVFALLAYYIWKTEHETGHRMSNLRGMLEIVSTMKQLNKGWYCAKAFEKFVLWNIHSADVYSIDLKRVDVDILDENGVFTMRVVYKKNKYAVVFFSNGKFYELPDVLRESGVKYRGSTERTTAVNIYSYLHDDFKIVYAPMRYHLVFCTVNPLLIFDCIGKPNGKSIFGIHHRDHNELNNNQNNLVFMNVSMHQKLHKLIHNTIANYEKKGIYVSEALKSEISEECYNDMFYFTNCNHECCHMRGV